MLHTCITLSDQASAYRSPITVLLFASIPIPEACCSFKRASTQNLPVPSVHENASGGSDAQSTGMQRRAEAVGQRWQGMRGQWLDSLPATKQLLSSAGLRYLLQHWLASQRGVCKVGQHIIYLLCCFSQSLSHTHHAALSLTLTLMSLSLCISQLLCFSPPFRLLFLPI